MCASTELLQEYSKEEKAFVKKEKDRGKSLLDLASDLGYGFSSRESHGVVVAPEPLSFEEAESQLRASKEMVKVAAEEKRADRKHMQELAEKKQAERAEQVVLHFLGLITLLKFVTLFC